MRAQARLQPAGRAAADAAIIAEACLSAWLSTSRQNMASKCAANGQSKLDRSLVAACARGGVALRKFLPMYARRAGCVTATSRTPSCRGVRRQSCAHHRRPAYRAEAGIIWQWAYREAANFEITSTRDEPMLGARPLQRLRRHARGGISGERRPVCRERRCIVCAALFEIQYHCSHQSLNVLSPSWCLSSAR